MKEKTQNNINKQEQQKEQDQTMQEESIQHLLESQYNENKKIQKKSKLLKKITRVMDIIFNILLVPIMIVIGIVLSSVLVSKIKTGVASIFGYTQIRIVSGSMQDAGFKVGEKTFVKQTDTDSLVVGDYIAFYQFYDTDCPNPGAVTEDVYPKARAKGRIVFHAIYGITTDSNGNRWFTTKGTNNVNPDHTQIYEKYVLGKWVDQPNALTNFITFATSPKGIVCLISLPCSLIITVDVYQLILYIFEYKRLQNKTVSQLQSYTPINTKDEKDKKDKA